MKQCEVFLYSLSDSLFQPSMSGYHVLNFIVLFVCVHRYNTCMDTITKIGTLCILYASKEHEI